MTRSYSLTLPLAALLCGFLPAIVQTYQIKSIHFKGDSEHTEAELCAAADIAKGASLTMTEINDHTKLLMDTGMFQNVVFKFNSQDLTYELTPVTDLYALRLENFPIAINTGLDDRLHAKLPLYHGKVPASGTMLDGVMKELQDELGASGIKATVAVTPHTDLELGKVTAMSFAITDPDVEVGHIQLQGASPAFAEKANAVLAKSSGTPYSFDGSISQLQTSLANFYGAQGYLEPKIQVVAQPGTTVDAGSIRIPLTVTVEEGLQYKLASVQLAPGLIVSQADFDKTSSLHPGEVVSLVKLRSSLEYLSRQYHNHGYIRAVIHQRATFDRTQGTVAYTVSVEPGPIYTTGRVRVKNVSDDLRDMTLAMLKLPPGETFNEGAIRGMMATHDVNPAFERIISKYNLSYTLTRHEDTHVVDVDITLEPRRP
jgi:outer membrane protein assembly factor BamA